MEYKEERDILIGEGKIIIKLILNGTPPQYTLIINSIDNKDYILFESLIDVKTDALLNQYLDNLVTFGIMNSLNKFDFSKNDKYTINNNNNIIVTAYSNKGIKITQNKDKDSKLNAQNNDSKTNELREKNNNKVINDEKTNKNIKINNLNEKSIKNNDNTKNNNTNNNTNTNNINFNNIINKEENLLSYLTN